VTKKNGVILGAKPKYPEYRDKVREMRKEGLTWKEICDKLNINYRTAKKAAEE